MRHVFEVVARSVDGPRRLSAVLVNVIKGTNMTILAGELISSNALC